MHGSTLAKSPYQVNDGPIRSDRSVEYQAFAKVTGALSKITNDPDASFETLASAIHDNRKLWNILATDVMSDGNGLPADLRAGIFSLSQFVALHSPKVLDGSATADALIEVNTSIMRGLRNG